MGSREVDPGRLITQRQKLPQAIAHRHRLSPITIAWSIGRGHGGGPNTDGGCSHHKIPQAMITPSPATMTSQSRQVISPGVGQCKCGDVGYVEDVSSAESERFDAHGRHAGWDWM